MGANGGMSLRHARSDAGDPGSLLGEAGGTILSRFAAAAFLSAALAHLWSVPERLETGPAMGVAFLLVSLVQGLYGVALLRWPSRGMTVAGFPGNLAVVAFYAIARSAGAESGSHRGLAEALGSLGLICTAAGLGMLLVEAGGTERSLRVAEGLSFGAAFVHLWEMPEHYEEWWVLGVFFLAVGAAQGLYGLSLPRLGSRVSFLLAGVAGNILIVAIWTLTRTAGIPYIRTNGVESPELRLGMVEAVGGPDLAATAIEVALAAVLVAVAAKVSGRLRAEAVSNV